MSKVLQPLMIAAALIGAATTPFAQANRIFVDDSATGNNDGTSWQNAYTSLKTAINAASSGDEIWVAAGTYKPGASGARNSTFNLKTGVAIYGGFNGTETEIYDRNWTVNICLLSGDLNGNGTDSLDAYNVVRAENGKDRTAVLDGFEIAHGYANGNDEFTNKELGGGVYINNSEPTIANCNIHNNYAIQGGSGACYYGDNCYGGVSVGPIFAGCTFEDNYTDASGAAMFALCGTVTITRCVFFSNLVQSEWADSAGAIWLSACKARIGDSLFLGNEAEVGGAIYNGMDTDTHITNSVFSGNRLRGGLGGAIYNYYHGGLRLVNCTFAGNTAPDGSGGASIYNCGGGSLSVYNCIFWDNCSGDYCGEGGISQNGDGFFYYSDVQDNSLSGTGLIDVEPAFIDPDGQDDIYGTLDDNVRLSSDSPCIDAGDNHQGDNVLQDEMNLDNDCSVTEPVPLDLDDKPRFINDPPTTDSGAGDRPIIDMGPYEFRTCEPCDTNCDSTIDVFDIIPFVEIIEGRRVPCSGCAADINGDGTTNAFDIQGFMACLPC